jgi:hypothetical protein
MILMRESMKTMGECMICIDAWMHTHAFGDEIHGQIHAGASINRYIRWIHA